MHEAMEEKTRSAWRREIALGLLAASPLLFASYFWGAAGYLAVVGVWLALGVLIWVCRNPLAALLILLLGLN
jgi:hypothetical protein